MSEATTLVMREQLPLLQEFTAPRTATERQLAEIWRRALTMDRVGMTDRFDDLGIDSLLAASIFADIENTFGIEIPMFALIEAPTIELLARIVERKAKTAPG